MPNETEPNLSAVDLEPLRNIARLYIQKRDLEAQLKNAKRQIAELQGPCLNTLTASGIPRLPLEVDGNTVTLHIHQQLWARPHPGDDGRVAVVEALAAEGMADDFLKTDFNIASISGWVREMVSAGEPLPEMLAAALNVTNVVEVRARVS
jgi:hypothetical protein